MSSSGHRARRGQTLTACCHRQRRRGATRSHAQTLLRRAWRGLRARLTASAAPRWHHPPERKGEGAAPTDRGGGLRLTRSFLRQPSECEGSTDRAQLRRSLDRLARSTRDLLNALAAIADKKAGLCLVRGPRGRAPGKSASQPSRGSAWPVWSPAAQRRGATNNGLHQYLHSVFPTAKGNGLCCWF